MRRRRAGWFRRFVRSIAIALAIATAWAPAKASAAGRSELIAFSSSRNGRLDIFTMNPKGGELRNLTNDPQQDFQPSWSPDGSRIAYVSLHTDVSDYDQIFTIDPVSGSRVQLTSFDGGNPQGPAWSPDGSRIAFHVSFGGAIDDELYAMNADGSDLVQLTDNRSADSDPAWAPDGKRIALVRNARIFTMRPDGTGVRPVTAAAMWAFEPAWSPRTRRIAFVGRDPTASQEDLYTIRPDGSGLRRLRPTARTETSPSWSPDGRRIVYVTTRDHYESDTQENWIFTTRPDGTHRVRLTADPATLDANPHWSPRDL